jgi:hypothetical protein
MVATIDSQSNLPTMNRGISKSSNFHRSAFADLPSLTSIYETIIRALNLNKVQTRIKPILSSPLPQPHIREDREVLYKTFVGLETWSQRRTNRHGPNILECRQRLGEGRHVKLLDAKDDFFRIKSMRL